jgi:UPF0716 family protein affecting phage T7 exclusion
MKCFWIILSILAVAALALIKPGWETDLVGFGLLIIIAGIEFVKREKIDQIILHIYEEIPPDRRYSR